MQLKTPQFYEALAADCYSLTGYVSGQQVKIDRVFPVDRATLLALPKLACEAPALRLSVGALPSLGQRLATAGTPYSDQSTGTFTDGLKGPAA